MIIVGQPRRKRVKKEPVTAETTAALKDKVTQALKEALKITDADMAKCKKDELPETSLVKRHNRYAYSLRTLSSVVVNEHNYRIIYKDLDRIYKDVKKYLNTKVPKGEQETES